MKKTGYFLLLALFLAFGFVSCSDDDQNDLVYTTSAEKASAGTYPGTWTRVLDGDTVTYQGSVTLAATDSINCTDVTFTCPEASINATSVANVWHSGSGYQFVNQLTTNGLGTAFSGRINGEGTLITAFTLTKKVGRKSYTYNFSFEGSISDAE